MSEQHDIPESRVDELRRLRPRVKLEYAALGLGDVVYPSREEIDAARTANGGWTRGQLAKWGVPWPPPKGWKKTLIKRHKEDK